MSVNEIMNQSKIQIQFNFEIAKGIAMLEYLLKMVGGKYNYMNLLKLAFFADRYHIRTYARLVSEDNYIATKLGPIPSRLKVILKYYQSYRTSLEIINYDVYLINPKSIKTYEFSESEIKAMEFAVKNFGKLLKKDIYTLPYLTQAYPPTLTMKYLKNTNSPIPFRNFLIQKPLQ